MNERQLHHMYQSWMQGREHAVRDWAEFVEFAAEWYSTTGDAVMRELQKFHWFRWGEE